MITSLIAFFLAADTVTTQPKDTLGRQPADTVKVDTLGAVVIHGDGLPVQNALNRTVNKYTVPRNVSVGDLLEKLSPGINDKITHPFAFKQRKKERRQKRTRKILEHYDQVKTFDELLREAIEREELLQKAQEKK